MSNQEARRGTVKFYIDEKLYGFLVDDASGEEVYIPVAGLIDEIKKNDRVTYFAQDGPKGVEAFDVRISKGK